MTEDEVRMDAMRVFEAAVPEAHRDPSARLIFSEGALYGWRTTRVENLQRTGRHTGRVLLTGGAAYGTLTGLLIGTDLLAFLGWGEIVAAVILPLLPYFLASRIVEALHRKFGGL